MTAIMARLIACERKIEHLLRRLRDQRKQIEALRQQLRDLNTGQQA